MIKPHISKDYEPTRHRGHPAPDLRPRPNSRACGAPKQCHSSRNDSSMMDGLHYHQVAACQLYLWEGPNHHIVEQSLISKFEVHLLGGL